MVRIVQNTHVCFLLLLRIHHMRHKLQATLQLVLPPIGLVYTSHMDPGSAIPDLPSCQMQRRHCRAFGDCYVNEGRAADCCATINANAPAHNANATTVCCLATSWGTNADAKPTYSAGSPNATSPTTRSPNAASPSCAKQSARSNAQNVK